MRFSLTARLAIIAALSLQMTAALSAQSPAPFAYDRQVPLRWQDSLVRTVEGIEEYAISYDSPLGGRVTGKLFRPEGLVPDARYAAILMGHGAPGSTATMAARALYFAKKGAVVVGIDAPFARRDPRDPINFTARDSAEQVQTIVDFRRLVDAVAARSDVDAARIAFHGVSYGGAVGAVLAGVEPRLAAYVLAVADLGFVEHFREPNGSLGGPLADLPAEQRERWVAAMAPVSGTTHFSRADGRKLLLQNSTQDEAVLVHVARAFHAAAPSGASIKWYESGHRLTPAHYFDQLVFLHERIGLAAPSAEDAAGPVFPAPAASASARPR